MPPKTVKPRLTCIQRLPSGVKICGHYRQLVVIQGKLYVCYKLENGTSKW
jgi:hypothetical protein